MQLAQLARMGLGAAGVPGNPYPAGSPAWTMYNYAYQKGYAGVGASSAGGPVTMVAQVAPTPAPAPTFAPSSAAPPAPVAPSSAPTPYSAPSSLVSSISAPALVSNVGAPEDASTQALFTGGQAKPATPAAAGWLLALLAAAGMYFASQ